LVASPKRSYNSPQQRQYYQEATKLFDGLTDIKGDKKHDSHIAGNIRRIEEWFQLFFHIVDNEKMLKELHSSLKVVLTKRQRKGGNHIEKYIEKTSAKGTMKQKENW